MELVLKILGVVFIGGILLILALVLYWRLLTARLAKTATPATLKLTLDHNTTWLATKQVQKLTGELGRLGFKHTESFTIENMNGLPVAAFYHEDLGIFSAVYRPPIVGPVVDLVAELTDDTEINVISAPIGQQMDTMPGIEKIFLPKAPPQDLFAELKKRVGNRTIRRLEASSFRSKFTESYAKEMAWRASRGGVSREEFDRVANDEKRTFTQEQRDAAFTQSKLQELRIWSDIAIEEFQASSTIPLSEWKKHEDVTVIVSESFHPPAFVEYLAETIFIEDKVKEECLAATKAGASINEIMAKIETLAGLRWARIGTVEQPVNADLYGVHPQ